jgi:hypothetical protein
MQRAHDFAFGAALGWKDEVTGGKYLPCNGQRATYSVQHTACNIQRATDNLQRGIPSLRSICGNGQLLAATDRRPPQRTAEPGDRCRRFAVLF